MKIYEIPNIPTGQLREFIQNFWANFHSHKKFLTLGCVLNRISQEKLWRAWGHNSMFRYSLYELHFPTNQHNTYIAAYRRLAALGVSGEEMERLERENTLYRILKVTKITNDIEQFRKIISQRGEDFRRSISQKKRERFLITLGKKEYELASIASRIMGGHSDVPNRQFVTAASIAIASVEIKGQATREKWIRKQCESTHVPQKMEQYIVDKFSVL